MALHKTFSPSFNKTGKLQVIAWYLPKFESALYKNPPKERRQGINYVNN